MKYELTNECIINREGIKLYRIIACKDFSDIKKGDKGGFVESEENLSQDGDCWIYDVSKVFGKGRVLNNAKVRENTRIFGHGKIMGSAEVYGNSIVKHRAAICGCVKVSGEFSGYEIKCLDVKYD